MTEATNVTGMERRVFTEHERYLVNLYMLCECGSPRAPRWDVTTPDATSARRVEVGFECLWNGHR